MILRIDRADCRSVVIRTFAISTLTGQVDEIALGLDHGCYANQTRRLLHNPLGQMPRLSIAGRSGSCTSAIPNFEPHTAP
jgi:hypothetical protein